MPCPPFPTSSCTVSGRLAGRELRHITLSMHETHSVLIIVSRVTTRLGKISFPTTNNAICDFSVVRCFILSSLVVVTLETINEETVSLCLVHASNQGYNVITLPACQSTRNSARRRREWGQGMGAMERYYRKKKKLNSEPLITTNTSCLRFRGDL